MGVIEAIGASERLCRRGDLSGAARALAPYAGDRSIDLQRGVVASEAVLLDGLDPGEVESILEPHIDEGRALDLIGLSHFHSAITSGVHSVAQAVTECTSASRLSFDDPCWQTANTLHIGMTQQALGSHDIAEIYLRDAYRSSGDCPSERASAAFHLGLDALARGDAESAVQSIDESLHIRRSHDIDVRVPETLVALANALEGSQPEEAAKLVDEAVELARDLPAQRPLAVALAARGVSKGHRSDLEEGFDVASRLGDHKLSDSIAKALEHPRET